MPNVMDRVAAQAAGTIGALRASVKGLRGVFLRLPEEHREVLALVQRAAAADDEAARIDLWTDARNELLAHERAEDETVYPQFANYVELGDIVEQHEALARELRAAVTAVDAAGVGSPHWQLGLAQVESILRRHAELEDEHFFPRAQVAVGNERAVEIEGLYTNARRSALHELKFPTHDDPSDGR